MRVVRAKPPNWAAIAAALGPPPPNAVFAYGDVVYSPSTDELPLELEAHESVHLRQQAEVGGPEAWREKYLADPSFRLAQEIEAYGAQVASHTSRDARRSCLARCARDLSSAMYGGIIGRAAARDWSRFAARNAAAA